ncbi:MAG: rhodanese-like domain-containing protein [Bacteroidales bacterium]|nr:rhodanese-like domain-containing protein [Bacteroidales bacterium]
MKRLAFCILLMIPFFGFAQHSISVEESMQLINNTKKLQIVDVRTPQEFDSIAIQKAVNIDYKNPSFKDNIQVLDKTKPVLVYCRSGKRSLNAMNIMVELGFSEVYNMQGGILAFKKQYPSFVNQPTKNNSKKAK